MSSKERKKDKIKAFIDSDRTDYTKFIRNELEQRVSPHQMLENSDIKEQVEENREDITAYNKWMPNGMYGKLVGRSPYQELDFEQFSFNVLQHLSEDSDLNETIEIIKELPRTGRRKQLRIYLFESLRSIRSPYFDPALFYDIKEHMVKTANFVQRQIEQEGYEILTKGFDSFSFIAPDADAERLQQEINNQLDVSRLTLDKYRSAIKFYNVALFQEPGGDWFMVKTNGTDYDQYKEQVCKALTDKDFQKAYNALSDGKSYAERTGELNPEKFKEYAAKLTQIQQSDDSQEYDSTGDQKLDQARRHNQ